MATAWTTPILCGAAALVSSSTLEFDGYANLPVADAVGDWDNYLFSSAGETGDTIKLTTWDTEIPGAGANVSRMKVTVQGSENIAGGDATMRINGHGITINQDTLNISGSSYSTYTADETVATWGISASEIDLLVSNSASYGLEFYITTDAWQSSQVNIRNVYLSFEYNARRGIYIS